LNLSLAKRPEQIPGLCRLNPQPPNSASTIEISLSNGLDFKARHCSAVAEPSDIAELINPGKVLRHDDFFVLKPVSFFIDLVIFTLDLSKMEKTSGQVWCNISKAQKAEKVRDLMEHSAITPLTVRLESGL
jgi:hypothetical protein